MITFDLSGKRLLVIGASSGIGRAVAEMALASGAQVAVSARRADKLAEITGATAIAADVREEADCKRLVDEALAAMGGIDAMIFAVGMSPLVPMAKATADNWREVLETNVMAAALITSAVAPHLIESGGRALLVSSKSVRRPFPDLALYTTSKIALDGLIKCLPVEFPGLQVTRVVVGNTADTDFATTWDAEAVGIAHTKWIETGVLGSMGMMHANQVAEAILGAVASSAHIDDIAIIDRDIDDGSWNR